MGYKFSDVEEYISTFPLPVQQLLEELRHAIRNTVPGAQEVISYNMPAYQLGKVLVWFAAYKNHIGFYPSSDPIELFKEELKSFKTSKGAIQFSLDQPLPIKLIKKIVRHRMKEYKGYSKW